MEICEADAEDVHHIKFQYTADSDDIIDGHIDKKVRNQIGSSLPSVTLTSTIINYSGYKQTSKGIKLQYHEVPTEQFAEHKQSRKK